MEPPAVKVLDPNCPTCQTRRIRETTGMVCQTCGTDYAPAVNVSATISDDALVYIDRETKRWGIGL